MNTLKFFSYQCEAAVLLPEHTAVAGRLLTAALRGHCFSETAAQSTFMDKLHFEDDFLQAANGKRPRILCYSYLLLVGVIKQAHCGCRIHLHLRIVVEL